MVPGLKPFCLGGFGQWAEAHFSAGRAGAPVKLGVGAPRLKPFCLGGFGQWAEAHFSAGRAGAQHQGGPVKRGRNTKADQNGPGLKPFLLCRWASGVKPTSPAVRQWTKQGSLGGFGRETRCVGRIMGFGAAACSDFLDRQGVVRDA